MPPDSVEGYLAGLDGWQAEAVAAFHQLIMETVSTAACSLKWARPFYEAGGPVAYITAFKGHVDLGFCRGVEIDDPKGLLEGTGKSLRHVKIPGMCDARPEAFAVMLRFATEFSRVD